MLEFLPEGKDWLDVVSTSAMALIAAAGVYISLARYGEERSQKRSERAQKAAEATTTAVREALEETPDYDKIALQLNDTAAVLAVRGDNTITMVMYTVARTIDSIGQAAEDKRRPLFIKLWHEEHEVLKAANALTGKLHYTEMGQPIPPELRSKLDWILGPADPPDPEDPGNPA